MAGRKLSARAEEEVVFLESLLLQIDHLKAKTEQYAGAKKGDDILMFITRQLTHIRQNAMMKNLGPIADQAGLLSVAAGRGSQMQRARTLREGIAGYEQLVERTMKATTDADARQRAEKEKELAAKSAAGIAPAAADATKPAGAGPATTAKPAE